MPSTMSTVEVITRAERRRRWGREEKQRLVAESARPERTVSQVARAHGAAESAVHLAAPVSGGSRREGFVPARLTEEGPASLEAPTCSAVVAARLEIRLPSRIVINIVGEVSSENLRCVLAALTTG